MGYFITIKNNLLDAKHVAAMGNSVWLYMWLIDKVMAINENGIGKVFNGRPVIHERIEKDLGITRSTYYRWVKQLEDAKYIRTIRTPRGVVIYVNKAAKMWGNKAAPTNASLFENDVSPKNETSKDKKAAKTAKTSPKNDTSPVPFLTHQSPKNDTSNSNNSTLTILSNNKHAQSAEKEKTEIGKLYYQVIKKYDLPVANNNVIWVKIREWERGKDHQATINYLTFLLTHYQTIDIRYKPELSTALDIYTKRIAIKNALAKYMKKSDAIGVVE